MHVSYFQLNIYNYIYLKNKKFIKYTIYSIKKLNYIEINK